MPKMGLMELVLIAGTCDQQWILVSQKVSQLTYVGEVGAKVPKLEENPAANRLLSE